ncbi:MAG: sulfite exporter TauE/SafE family protein [Magnetococcus sp. DMHC-1]|nr:sulfite exporter TauE/SafE family protein [Magnetococcales bacterium]
MFFLILGSVVVGFLGGYFSGLLGIGGGMVMVPALLFLFYLDGLAPLLAWQLAVGSVIAASVVIDLAVAWLYLRQNSIRWDLVRTFLPGILLGLLVGTSFSSLVPGTFVEAGLAFLMMALGLRMLQELPPTDNGESREVAPDPDSEAGLATQNDLMQRDDWRLSSLLGIGIGFLGGMSGIGGTILLVPTLIFITGLSVQQSIATTAATGSLLSLAGSVGLVNAGWHQEILPADSLGLILPGIIVAMTLGALVAIPFGNQQNLAMSHQRLMQSFGVVLLAGGVEVIWR